MPAAWCDPSKFRVTVPSAIHTIQLVAVDAPSIFEMTGAQKECDNAWKLGDPATRQLMIVGSV